MDNASFSLWNLKGLFSLSEKSPTSVDWLSALYSWIGFRSHTRVQIDLDKTNICTYIYIYHIERERERESYKLFTLFEMRSTSWWRSAELEMKKIFHSELKIKTFES